MVEKSSKVVNKQNPKPSITKLSYSTESSQALRRRVSQSQAFIFII
jgi:hypothetical protein